MPSINDKCDEVTTQLCDHQGHFLRINTRKLSLAVTFGYRHIYNQVTVQATSLKLEEREGY